MKRKSIILFLVVMVNIKLFAQSTTEGEYLGKIMGRDIYSGTKNFRSEYHFYKSLKTLADWKQSFAIAVTNYNQLNSTIARMERGPVNNTTIYRIVEYKIQLKRTVEVMVNLAEMRNNGDFIFDSEWNSLRAKWRELSDINPRTQSIQSEMESLVTKIDSLEKKWASNNPNWKNPINVDKIKELAE